MNTNEHLNTEKTTGRRCRFCRLFEHCGEHSINCPVVTKHCAGTSFLGNRPDAEDKAEAAEFSPNANLRAFLENRQEEAA